MKPERLTKPDGQGRCLELDWLSNLISTSNQISCVLTPRLEKLKKIEDLEEELGIDLLKLLSAQEVYFMEYKKPWNRDSGFAIESSEEFYLDLKRRIIVFDDGYSQFHVSLQELKTENYGRNDVWHGWAFTKEELED